MQIIASYRQFNELPQFHKVNEFLIGQYPYVLIYIYGDTYMLTQYTLLCFIYVLHIYVHCMYICEYVYMYMCIDVVNPHLILLISSATLSKTTY